MNERREHRVQCAADESMYVHGEQRADSRSRPFHESVPFTLLPPRPRSHGHPGRSFRGSELQGLQVQGFCCPLQQRPSSGRVTHRVPPPSRGGGDGSLTLLSRLRGRLESRAKPTSSCRARGAPETTTGGGAPAVGHHRGPVSETADDPTPPCDSGRQARRGRPGAAKVSELHLYLPSSLSEDEEQDAETEETRFDTEGFDADSTSAQETGAQGSEVKPHNPNPPVVPNPSHTSQDQSNTPPQQHTL